MNTRPVQPPQWNNSQSPRNSGQYQPPPQQPQWHRPHTPYPPQQQWQQQPAKSRPGRLEAFWHTGKTFKFVGTLLADPRISISRKALFIIGIGALLSLLFVPDAVAEFILSIAIPLVGPVVGVPLNIGADWMAIMLLSPMLFHIFPAHIRAEHYQWIFRDPRA